MVLSALCHYCCTLWPSSSLALLVSIFLHSHVRITKHYLTVCTIGFLQHSILMNISDVPRSCAPEPRPYKGLASNHINTQWKWLVPGRINKYEMVWLHAGVLVTANKGWRHCYGCSCLLLCSGTTRNGWWRSTVSYEKFQLRRGLLSALHFLLVPWHWSFVYDGSCSTAYGPIRRIQLL